MMLAERKKQSITTSLHIKNMNFGLFLHKNLPNCQIKLVYLSP